MKKNTSVAIAAFMMLLVSCNDNTSNKEVISDTTRATIMPDTPVNKMNNEPQAGKTITDKDVTDFVANAANAGMVEVELGNYAMQHAKSQRVKDFGSMMVADHTAANNELKSMATSNGIMVPAEIKAEDKDHISMMEKKEGAAFDKAYMDMMVDGHKKVADDFKKASTDLKEDAYKAFASKTLPVIEKHLDSAKAIKKAM